MDISVNAKQVVAVVWTIIAIVISLILVLSLGTPSFSAFGIAFSGSWIWMVVLFFALFLVLTVPVYLLIALWHIVAKSDSNA